MRSSSCRAQEGREDDCRARQDVDRVCRAGEFVDDQEHSFPNRGVPTGARAEFADFPKSHKAEGQ
eukprot:320245-Heterocapsa_arctica.AAC.1